MPGFGPVSSAPISALSSESPPGPTSVHSIHKGYRYRIFQALATPILPPDMVAEGTSIDKYEVNWRTPVWKRQQPIHTPGSFIDESVIPPDPIPRDYRPWYSPFSDPVRPKFRPYLYPWHWLELEPNQQPEEVTVDRFYSEFSQPFFPLSKRYRAHLFQAIARTDEATLVGETIYVPSFDSPFGLPVPGRKRSVLYPIGVIQLEPNQFPEVICVCSYEANWSQPIFVRIPVRKYLDGGVIVPELFPMTGAILFSSKMLAGGFQYF